MGVDLRCQSLVEDGISEIRLSPVGSNRNAGLCLTVTYLGATTSLELTLNEGASGSTLLEGHRVSTKHADKTLILMIQRMLGYQADATNFREAEGTDPAELSQVMGRSWDLCIQGLTKRSVLEGKKAALLMQLDPNDRSVTVYDDRKDFGIIRRGDSPLTGKGIWITFSGEQLSLSVESRHPRCGSEIIDVVLLILTMDQRSSMS